MGFEIFFLGGGGGLAEKDRNKREEAFERKAAWKG